MKNRIRTAMLAVGLLAAGLTIAPLTDAAPAPAAQAAVSQSTRISCPYSGYYARLQVRNTSGSQITVQLWSYDGTKYYRYYTVPPYTTSTIGSGLGAAQFRMYSATYGYSYYAYCAR